MADVKAERREQVQVLRRLAKNANIERCSDRANKEAVSKMAHSLLDLTELEDEAREEAQAAWDAYRDTFDNWGDEDEAAPSVKEWRFHAAQLTYNNATDEAWRSKYKSVLRRVFDRLLPS